MQPQILLDLYHHMEWADAAMWTAVLASEKASADAGLRDRLRHLHMVQRAFLRAWRGEPREASQPQFADARSLMEWARSYHGEAIGHLASLGEEDLAAAMPAPWVAMVEQRLGRPPGVTTKGETALQVALHSLYHRAQVHAALRAHGGEPPLADYIAWLWHGRPAAQWPSA